MAKVMTKSQVVSHLAGKAGIQKKAAAAVLEEIAALATKECRSTGQFVIPGLGKAVKANRRLAWGAILRLASRSRSRPRRWSSSGWQRRSRTLLFPRRRSNLLGQGGGRTPSTRRLSTRPID